MIDMIDMMKIERKFFKSTENRSAIVHGLRWSCPSVHHLLDIFFRSSMCIE